MKSQNLPYFLLALAILCLTTNCVSKQKLREQRIEQYRPIFAKKLMDLRQRGYQAEQTPGGNPYIPQQFLVWHEDKSQEEIDALLKKAKDTYGDDFIGVDSCGCGREFKIQLWHIRGIDPNEVGDTGKKKLSADIDEEELEENLYFMPDIPAAGHSTDHAFTGLPADFVVKPSPYPGRPVKIAVVDSGIDYTYQDMTVDGTPALVFWKNPNEELDGQDSDNDPFCLPDDVMGWDFVNKDNDPMDDHSHGTHIAGVIAKQFRDHKLDLNYQLIPIKVLDHNGTGTSFQAACGVLYAAAIGADVINASWGHYGDQSRLLRAAFRFAEKKGALTVNSAGNERIDLSYIKHFPTQFGISDEYQLSSVIFVSALSKEGRLLPEANFRTEAPRGAGGMIAFPGDSIRSLIPRHLPNTISAYKSGTSFAAPVMTALAATYISLYPDHDPVRVRSNLIKLIQQSVEPKMVSPYPDNKEYPFYALDWVEITPELVRSVDPRAGKE